MAESQCSGCGASIQWKITPAGKRMPLDVDPRKEPEAGTYSDTPF